MKILFINKYDVTGGAAIAAFRLHNALKNNFNTSNLFLTGIKKSNYEFVIPTRKAGFQNFLERGLNFIFNQMGLQYKYHPFSTANIIEVAARYKPDIISIHNIHGGYFKTSLLMELSEIAPIVWTLHDMWAFTANAAHTFGDSSFKMMKAGKRENKLFPQIGLNTGNWLLKEKKRIYLNSNITIITPSDWLLNLAAQSPVFEGKKIIHIPNGVDTNVFHPVEKQIVREKFAIPENAKTLIFGAEKVLAGNYKGGDLLIDILKNLDSRLSEKIHLIIIGESNLAEKFNFKNFIIHEAGYIFDESKMAELLSASDLFIYPTKADNLPNALVESISCGIPAITYDVGGCKEIITDNLNGSLVPSGDVVGFVDKIMFYLSNPVYVEKASRECRLIAVREYDVKIMAESYYNLFLSIINNY